MSKQETTQSRTGFAIHFGQLAELGLQAQKNEKAEKKEKNDNSRFSPFAN
jgi:hypothetical protein